MPKPKKSILWKQFRILYELHIAKLAQSTQDDWYRAADELESVCRPKRLEDVDRACLHKFIARMKGKRAESTQQLYFTKIKSGLLWAYYEGYLDEKPRLRPSDFVKPCPVPSARAVSDLEFRKILDAVPLARRHDAGLWLRLLKASNWCDLRISELLRLSWDTTAPLCIVRADGQYMFHFRTHEAQKAWHPTYHPMMPECWEIISHDGEGKPLANHSGLVFPMRGFEYPHIQMSARNVRAIIRRIGEISGVITQDETGKPATAHDFGRRVYVQRILRRFPPHLAQKYVRHADIRTTMKHYNSQDAIELGKDLGWNDTK